MAEDTALQADHAAAAEFVREQARRACAARRIDDADDIIQHALTEWYGRIDRTRPVFAAMQVEGSDECKCYRRAIVNGLARHYRAKRKAGRQVALDRDLADETQDAIEEAVDARERIFKALARLPDEQKAILERRLDGKTFQQIADELGIPLTTVYRRYEAAREPLKTALNWGNEP